MTFNHERFPYNLPSRQAMVALVQETKPEWRIYDTNVEFNSIRHVPMAGSPGRTFIEVVNRDLGVTRPYFYRRLDLAVTMEPSLTIPAPRGDIGISPREIVEYLNAEYGLRLGRFDVDMSDRKIHPRTGEETRNYILRALPGSYVWFGEVEVLLEYDTGDIPDNVRLLESGSVRLLEDGGFRLLETTPP